MEKLILAISIICFIVSFLILIAEMKKVPFILFFILKGLSLFGVLLPLIYWLILNDVLSLAGAILPISLLIKTK
jgi:hypothetical protein